MMRIVIFSGLVASSMAACAGDGMYFCSYANNTAAANDTNLADGPGGANAATVACGWLFEGACQTIRGAGVGAFSSVPWPVTGNSFNGSSMSATNFTKELASVPANLANDATGIMLSGVASSVYAVGATCETPQWTYMDAALAADRTTCGTGISADQLLAAECGNNEANGADATHGILPAVFQASGATWPIVAYNDAHNATLATTDLETEGLWTAAASFTLVEMKFWTNATCAGATTASATAAVNMLMPLFKSNGTGHTKNVAGLCSAVAVGTSYKFYCDLATGSILHVGYPSDTTSTCASTPGTNDTTTWAASTTDLTTTAWSSNGHCKQWKAVSGLYVSLSITGGTGNAAAKLVDTNTKLAALCTATAAPTAAPASGAAAVGTAAAVAAGAAALIL